MHETEIDADLTKYMLIEIANMLNITRIQYFVQHSTAVANGFGFIKYSRINQNSTIMCFKNNDQTKWIRTNIYKSCDNYLFFLKKGNKTKLKRSQSYTWQH